MRTTRIHSLTAAPDAIASAMDTDGFLLARATHDPAYISARVVRLGPGRVRVDSTMHARGKTGSIDRSRQESSGITYDWDAARRTVRWTWTGKTVIPVEVRGTWSLEPAGSGTRLRSEVEVKVKARLVGKLVEGIVSKQLSSAEDALPGDVRAHLG
jgi:YD repeat-containing protein